MVDKVTPEQRSRNMSRVKGQDTAPEKAVRSLLHRMGYRFRLHSQDLPGRPDIVLRKYRTVIFVHGCFWHGHVGCPRAKRPTTNTEFWNAKIDGNIARDASAAASLRAQGWRVMTLWQCRIKNQGTLTAELQDFLIKGETTEE